MKSSLFYYLSAFVTCNSLNDTFANGMLCMQYAVIICNIPQTTLYENICFQPLHHVSMQYSKLAQLFILKEWLSVQIQVNIYYSLSKMCYYMDKMIIQDFPPLPLPELDLQALLLGHSDPKLELLRDSDVSLSCLFTRLSYHVKERQELL